MHDSFKRRLLAASLFAIAFLVVAFIDSQISHVALTGVIGMAACLGITDNLTRESGRIGTDIYGRQFGTEPWTHLIGQNRGTFPEGEGETISVLTYERSAPLVAEPTWSAVTVVDGAEGGACLPSATKVGIASTLRNYNLKRMALEGPDFCAEEARTVFALREQLDKIIGVLTERTQIEWAIHNRHEYMRLCKRKVVVTSTGVTEDNTGLTDFSTMVLGTAGILTQGILDKYKLKVRRDGANQTALGKLDGQGVLTVILGAEASENIIRGDSNIRDDLRWGNPGELLKQIGVERSYRGFFHVIDDYPIRYKVVAGALVEVPAFAGVAATKGTKSDINSDYEDPTIATLEVGYIFDPTVFQQLIPKPITAPHPNFKFDPISYMGTWKLMNIPDRICNPDGNIVYHRGILAAGSKPIHPERGVAFLYKRCDTPPGYTGTCPT